MSALLSQTLTRARVVGAIDPLDATPDRGGYSYLPQPETLERWHVSEAPGGSMLILSEYLGEPIAVSVEMTEFLPLMPETSDAIAATWREILQRRLAGRS